MSLNEAGNHLIAISTKPSYIEMEGAAFNDYLKEDGMANILSYREKNNLKEKSGIILEKKDLLKTYTLCPG